MHRIRCGFCAFCAFRTLPTPSQKLDACCNGWNSSTIRRRISSRHGISRLSVCLMAGPACYCPILMEWCWASTRPISRSLDTRLVTYTPCRSLLEQPFAHHATTPPSSRQRPLGNSPLGKIAYPLPFEPLSLRCVKHLQLIAHHPPELQLTHGDCWYKNAIKTPQDGVVLIDRDCAGVGLPILDLGYLLLTSHYDLAQPLSITADAEKIRAIMRGYQAARPISPQSVRRWQALCNALKQFILANIWRNRARLRQTTWCCGKCKHALMPQHQSHRWL